MTEQEITARLQAAGFTPADAAKLAAGEAERQRQAGPSSPPGQLTIPAEVASDPAAAHQWWLERLVEEPNRTAGHHPATAAYLGAVKAGRAPQRPQEPEDNGSAANEAR